MGTLIGSLITIASVALTDPIITYSYVTTMSLNHTDIDSTASRNMAHSTFEDCPPNLNSVHQYLQSSNPHALFLTETKLRLLDPNDTSVLFPHLKCPGFELFSSFFPNGGVCTFICPDVQTFQLTQFDLSNSGFQLIWLKISPPWYF